MKWYLEKGPGIFTIVYDVDTSKEMSEYDCYHIKYDRKNPRRTAQKFQMWDRIMKDMLDLVLLFLCQSCSCYRAAQHWKRKSAIWGWLLPERLSPKVKYLVG